ncbi:rod shape-determining protein MreD [Sungkyunkwania multivorans]|uniref:Rod shape-determining protein MreD n=1 Tax=Sungkyunkwania multivorans TaxID=1173618 RepID=A0ABW3D1L1_9FLAO
MNRELFLNIGRFVVLLLAQVSIFNNIDFLGYVNPYVYFLFVISYPFGSNRSVFLLAAFFMGLTIDIFTDAGGINAAACLIAAFARPVVLRSSFGVSYEFHTLKLSRTALGERITYVFIMVVIHHLVLFSLEIFNVSNILLILKKTLFSSIFTVLLCLLFIILFSNKKQ